MLPDKDGPAVGGGQTSDKEDPSVSLFREYLRLRTVHPEPDYGETHSFRYTELQTRPFWKCHSCQVSIPYIYILYCCLHTVMPFSYVIVTHFNSIVTQVCTH